MTDVALPPLAQMTAELADLGEPQDGAEAAEMVASFEAAIEQVEAEPAKVLKGTVNPFEEAEKQAAAFGLKACSQI